MLNHNGKILELQPTSLYLDLACASGETFPSWELKMQTLDYIRALLDTYVDLGLQIANKFFYCWDLIMIEEPFRDEMEILKITYRRLV